jgi:hypothetical protein
MEAASSSESMVNRPVYHTTRRHISQESDLILGYVSRNPEILILWSSAWQVVTSISKEVSAPIFMIVENLEDGGWTIFRNIDIHVSGWIVSNPVGHNVSRSRCENDRFTYPEGLCLQWAWKRSSRTGWLSGNRLTCTRELLDENMGQSSACRDVTSSILTIARTEDCLLVCDAV